jgi:hypothetical protein
LTAHGFDEEAAGFHRLAWTRRIESRRS